MASPFKFFRKNQTQLLVVIGLLTMVSFIILPSVLQMMQVTGNTQVANTTVVTKKYGNLTSNDMLRLKNQQGVMAGFFSRLAGVYQNKLQQLMVAQKQDAYLEFQKFYVGYMMVQRNLTQVSNQSDRAVVANWLMEHKAANMGITVSDEMVKDFIVKSTEGLDTTEYNIVVYGDPNPDAKATQSEDALIGAVRSFMTRNALFSVYGASWEVNTTGERLDSFCRLNQFANVELYPVNVANFVEKVSDPTEAEIKGFFEIYKDKEAEDSITDIGLRQPQKIAVDYCTASLASFLKPDAVTDEQVQKYYDDNKENFVIEKNDKDKTPEIGKMPEIGLNTKEYKPLDDELKNIIRQSIALQNAQEQMKQAIGKVQKAMEDYTVAKDSYEMNFTEEDRNSKEEVKAQAPKAVDFTALAKENGLTYGNTGLVSAEKFATTPLAELRLADTDTTISAASELFGKTPTFRVGIYESQGNLVIAWKCEDAPAHTPTLDEEGIVDQIKAQFKFRAAKNLAKAEADTLVKKAIEEKLPLKVCLGDTAFVPPQFSWFTYTAVSNPNMERQIYLGAVEGVQNAGFDFMQSIFQMKAGEIKTVANSTETTFYVTRMIGLDPPFEQMNARFLVTPETEYAQARSADGQLFFRELYEKFEKEAGLTWVIRPDEDNER